MNRFNPFRIFKEIVLIWQEFIEALEAREELDRIMRQVKAFPVPEDMSQSTLNYRYCNRLMELFDKTESEIIVLRFQSCLTYEELHTWAHHTGGLPSKDAYMVIRHFGVDFILRLL